MSELEYLKGRLQKGAISRREFMGRAAALGASTLAISSVLASVDAYAAETPKNGGALRLGLGGGSTTDSIDIGSYTDSVMIAVGHGLFNGIVEWGEDGKPKPDLATSWEAKDGAKEWIFNLRKGVKFSNGKEFDADDAIYSLNYHRGDTKSGGKAALCGGLRHQEARLAPDSGLAQRGRRGSALQPDRLSHPDCRPTASRTGPIRSEPARSGWKNSIRACASR